ncbi:MAG: flagellar biosynthesis anti-sigma factor FlgM [Fibrobacterota bacterium]
MRLLPIQQKITSELRKVESTKRIEKTSTQRRANVDRSEFSSDAQRLSDTKASAEIVSAQVAAQPDIRTEKVEEVRQKINSGFYDSPEFIDKLADKLLNDFGVSDSQNPAL